jgi:hypothetical protein
MEANIVRTIVVILSTPVSFPLLGFVSGVEGVAATTPSSFLSSFIIISLKREFIFKAAKGRKLLHCLVALSLFSMRFARFRISLILHGVGFFYALDTIGNNL